MRRMITIGVAAALTALVLPAAAMARHSSHHGRSHRRHHRAHTVVFSPATVRHTTPTPTTGETPPSNSEGEAAGTIASFEGGVLKITLADGTTVSGKVTEQTRIECGCPGHEGEGGEEGEDHSWSGGGDGGFSGGGSQGDDEHGSVPSGTPGSEEAPSCGTSALVPGAKVQEAELMVGSGGAVWEKVDLAHS